MYSCSYVMSYSYDKKSCSHSHAVMPCSHAMQSYPWHVATQRTVATLSQCVMPYSVSKHDVVCSISSVVRSIKSMISYLLTLRLTILCII